MVYNVVRKERNPEGANYVWRDVSRLVAPAFRVIGDIYYVGNRDVSSHLIISDEGHILIDTGFSTTVPLLFSSIKKLGFNPRDIKIILNTHAHVDHTGGNRKIIEETEAKVAIGEMDVEAVEKGTPLTCAYYFYGIEDYETFKVDICLKDGDTVTLADKSIKVYHTPGHTPGACSFMTEVPHEDKRLNVFLFGAPGQWTFQDIHRSQGYPGDLEDYMRTLSKLESLQVDVWLGAHPSQNKTFEKARIMEKEGEKNPFIDPLGWKDFLKNIELDFGRLLEQKFADSLQKSRIAR